MCKVIKYMKNGIIITSDDEVYAYSIEPLREAKYTLLMQGPTQEGYANTLYGIKGSSNTIYKFQIVVGTKKVNGFNRTYYKVEKEQVDYSVPEGEIIISFAYNINEEEMINDFIRTDKSYYSKRIINASECKDYVDIKCQYEWYKDEALSKIADKLIYAYDGEIVTKEGKIYQKNR